MLDGEYKTLQSNLILILDDNDKLIDGPLDNVRRRTVKCGDAGTSVPM